MTWNLIILVARAAALVVAIGALFGCSKRPEDAAGKPKIREALMTPPASEPQSAEVNPPLPAELPKAQLEQLAKDLGLSVAQAEPFLKRQQTLWRGLEEILKSDDASAAVPTLLAIVNVLSGAAEAPTTGEKLPDSFLRAIAYDPSSSESPTIKMMKAGFMGVSAERLPEQHVLYAGVQEIARLRPDLLATLAQERAKALPPTAADYIIFEATLNGLADSPFMESTGDDSEKPKTLPYGSELLALAKAPNPIYRLLAVRTARHAESDKAKLAGFYSGFVNETDPFIQAAAVDGLATMRATVALSALQSFEAKARQQGNTELEDAAKQAIKQLGDG